MTERLISLVSRCVVVGFFIYDNMMLSEYCTHKHIHTHTHTHRRSLTPQAYVSQGLPHLLSYLHQLHAHTIDVPMYRAHINYMTSCSPTNYRAHTSYLAHTIYLAHTNYVLPVDFHIPQILVPHYAVIISDKLPSPMTSTNAQTTYYIPLCR